MVNTCYVGCVDCQRIYYQYSGMRVYSTCFWHYLTTGWP